MGDFKYSTAAKFPTESESKKERRFAQRQVFVNGK